MSELQMLISRDHRRLLANRMKTLENVFQLTSTF